MTRVTRAIAVAVVAVIATTVAPIAGGAPATAAQEPRHDRVVSAEPSTATPNIADGRPNAILRIGDRVIVGGTFTEVADRETGKVYARPHLFAFDAGTGLVDPEFTPEISHEVTSLLPGPDENTVYVGGPMRNVNGVQGYDRLVLLNLVDGSLVTSFRAPPMNGAVLTFKQAADILLVGGLFTTVDGVKHGGLVGLNPRTGARLSRVDINLTEHHNYNGSGARAPVGAGVLDVTADGTTAVVIGNFKKANGMDRDQVVLLDLTGTQARIRDWHTDHYKPACSRRRFDKWVRDVSFSPDGSYFVIVTTGGRNRNTLCDTAARWETNATGTSLSPTWVNFAGGDTLLSVAVTETAVYTGGHQRWMNNHAGADRADTGAVGRPGIAALDPVSGVPLSWNPGRNPRGFGTTVLYPTPDGLYVGSDTNFIGDRQHRREKIAFFPLAGGTVPPAGRSANLPADVHFTNVPVSVDTGQSADDAGIAKRSYNGTAVGPVVPVGGADGTEWGKLRGIFHVDDMLFYGMSDGTFWRRSFDGAVLGTPERLDPHLDPTWDGVRTGSKRSTYSGRRSSFATAISSMRSMYYTEGRIFYTRAGQNTLYWRWFNPENGLAGSREFTLAGSSSLNNLSDTSGLLFLSNGFVYWVRAADGRLMRRALVDQGPGTEQVITANRATPGLVWGTGNATAVSGPDIDGIDWRTPGAFLRAG